MKVSLNWVKEFTKVDLPVDELVSKIGAQLGEVEEVIDLGKKYQGIVIAKVVSCIKHPNADKLHVCKIGDGGKTPKVERDSDGYVQVVCGAPNVREGLMVAWLPPGATVPSSVDKDPFVLEARDLRGQKSNGMLASAAELALGDNHDGLLELNTGKPGDDFAKTYGLDDVIIDIENKMFTHRPDCFGQLGVAREIAGIQGNPFHSPEWYLGPVRMAKPAGKSDGFKLEIKNELPELTPRFIAQVITGVEVKASDASTQAFLSKLGIRPINNIVDITNAIMLQTGQPLHAYDYDKVKALSGGTAKLVIRYPRKGEKIKLLNGKEVTLRAEAIMIATDKQLIGLAGVMGGADTEVDANTKNIILECATFDMYSIRRTSMEHGLFTDAVTRFTKGQSPLQCDKIMKFAINSIVGEEPGGELAGEIIDDNHAKAAKRAVHVTANFINDRLGLTLKPAEIKKLLENVEFTVHEEKGTLAVTVPFWRTDIEIAEDVVEEVGRLYGYDHLPLELPRRSLQPAPRNALLDAKAKAREVLAAAGANELLTYTFVHKDLLDKVGQDSKNAFQLSNALSPELQYYRMSLLPSLLDKVHANIKAGVNEFALFEINQVHSKDLIDRESKLPIEEHRLGLVFAADDKTAKAKYGGAPYYQAKKYLSDLLNSFGVQPIFEPATSHEPKMAVGKAAIAPFERSRAAYVKTADGKLLAELGEFTASVRRNLKLPNFAAGFELDIKRLMEESAKTSGYIALPRFPKVTQDITLKVPSELSYQELFDFVSSELTKVQPKDAMHRLSPVDVYQKPGDTKHKQITLRLSIASYERTLTGTEATKLLDEIAETAKTKLDATII